MSRRGDTRFWQVPRWLAWLSWLVEIPLDHFGIDGLPFRIVLVRGQPHLLGPKIVHSAGTDYQVLRMGFAHYGVYTWARTHQPFRVLLIGAGLGSALALLWQAGVLPDTVGFVEVNERVVDWAKRLLPPVIVQRTHFIIQDGWQFLGGTPSRLYHLVVVDVCTDERVPEWVYNPEIYWRLIDRWVVLSGWVLTNLFVHTVAFRQKAQQLIAQLKNTKRTDIQLDVFELPTRSNWLVRITTKPQCIHE